MPVVRLNTVAVETPLGTRRFNLYGGDITEAAAELLALSTHANPNLEFRGDVLTSLWKRFGSRVTEVKPLLLTRDIAGTYLATCEPKPPFDAVLLVRLPGVDAVQSQGGEPLEVYDQHLWSLFGSIAALELGGRGFHRLAMPLLGGQRQYNPRDAMRVIIENACRWLERSRVMEEVDLYLNEAAHIEVWDQAMDQALGRRDVSAARQGVAGALAADTLQFARELRGAGLEIAKACDGVAVSLERSPCFLQHVAASGRYLAEVMVKEMCQRNGVKWTGTLLPDVEALRKTERIAPWVISYLHSLRIFGNEELHSKAAVGYRPPALEDGDLIAILSAIQRLLVFWAKYRPEVA